MPALSIPYDLVVLAGGRARRLGGIDKVALPLAGRCSLTRLLDAATTAQRIVVVGPPRQTRRPVTWCRESPPGGGPLAAVAAALPLTSARAVVVVAGDMPRVGEALDRLRGELDGHPLADAAVLCDRHGVRQPLAAVYRRDSLRDRLRVIGNPADRAVRLLLDGMAVVEVAAPSATVDCDTWEDIAIITEELRVLDWTTALSRELGLDQIVDTQALLDAAHNVALPAAPITAFLVGYAAAGQGGGPGAVADMCRRASELARSWPPEAHQ